VKIIAGNFPAHHGEIRFEGKASHFYRPIVRGAVGTRGAIYRNPALADNLTAAAKVFIGREINGNSGQSPSLNTRRWPHAPRELFGGRSCVPRQGRRGIS